MEPKSGQETVGGPYAYICRNLMAESELSPEQGGLS